MFGHTLEIRNNVFTPEHGMEESLSQTVNVLFSGALDPRFADIYFTNFTISLQPTLAFM